MRVLTISLLALLSACSSNPGGPANSCKATTDCKAQQFCKTNVCVADSTPPTVSITSPVASALLTSATVSLEGTVKDDAAGVATLEYSLDATTFAALPFDSTSGAFTLAIPLPSVDRTDVTISVRAKDGAGNVGNASVAVTVDLLGPTIELSPPAKTAYNAADIGSTATFAVTASDKSGVAKLEWSLDDGATWTTCDKTDLYAYSVSVTSAIDGESVKLTMRATDEAGNVSTLASGSVVIDAKLPDLAITSPAANALFTTGSSFALAGTVSDKTLDTVTAILDGHENNPIPVTIAGTAILATVPIASEDFAQHLLVVTAKDKAGNATSVTLAYAVDEHTPVIAIASPQPDAIFSLQQAATATVSGTVTERDLDTFTYQLDAAAPVPVTSAATTGAFSFDLSLANEDWTAHTLSFTAKDKSGNTGSATLHFTVDRKPPVIVISAPAANQTLGKSAGTSFLASGTVTDGQLTLVTYSLDSGQPQTVTVDASNKFSIPIDLSAPEDYKPHGLKITATDGAGNQALVTQSFHVDNVAPVITITAPADDVVCGATCTPVNGVASASSSTIHFVGTVTDGSPAPTVGGEIGSTTPSANVVAGGWTLDWLGPANDDGVSYLAKFTATDAGGNTTSVSRIIYVDRKAPTLTWLQDNKRLISRGADLVRFSEPMNTATVIAAASWSADDPGFAVASDSKTFRAANPSTLKPYTAYTLTIPAGVTDRVGNALTSTSSESFLTETAPPAFSAVIATSVQTPRMAIDADGNPLIAYLDPVTNQFQLVFWNGKQWATSQIWQVASPFTGVAVHQIDVRSTAPVSLALHRTVRVLLSTNRTTGYTGPGLYLSTVADLDVPSPAWGRATVFEPAYMSPTAALFGSPSFRWVKDTSGNDTVTVDYTQVPASGGYTAYSKQLAGTTFGAAQALYSSTNSAVPHGMRGAGFARAGTGSPEVDAEAVYLPTGAEVKLIDATGDVSKPGGVSITGVPAAGGTSPTGTPWLFWSDYSGLTSPPFSFHVARLFLACSSTPSSVNPWHYSGVLASPVGTIVALDMAVTAGTVAVAAEDVNGSVAFASFDNSCSSTPAGPATWDNFVASGSGIATQPSVALGPGDTLWKAYVDTSFATPSLVLAP